VNAQGVVVARQGNGAARVIDQGLDEAAELDALVAVEAPGRLGRGEGTGGARQGAEPCRDNLKRGEVLLDQLEVSVLEPRLNTD
jgi:hypothetical protein